MPGTIKKNVALAPYTTLGVGGAADYVLEVHSIDQLIQALTFAQETSTPALVLGGGSNVVLSDKGYRGVVIINRISGIEYSKKGSGIVLRCGAGEVFDDLVSDTVAKGYWGLENLSAIPGSVGATPIQNVGAYGVEVAQLVLAVTAIHRDTLKSKTFSRSECQFGYRDSFFKSNEGKEWVVVGVEFLLRKNSTPTLTYADLQKFDTKTTTQDQVRQNVIAIRKNKFPDWHEIGTVGSFFKNPIVTPEEYERLQLMYPELPGHEVLGGVKLPLGWILDKVCSLRGYTQGHVGLYKHQALVLVAQKGATATEVLTFAQEIIRAVAKVTGIVVELEATVYDELGPT